MQITLYKNTAPLNKLSRTLGLPLTIAGYLREPCDVLNPQIEVEYNSTLLTYNYVYIPDFGRYYFINDSSVDGKTLALSMHVDVLYTYRNIIQASQCIANRSSSHYNPDVHDDLCTYENGWDYYSGVLPYEFKASNGDYILTVAGGT